MGTISDKLTYLNTTKGKIKDAINLTNANILSEDTFRSYAEKLKLGLVDIINNGTDDLYDSFPKTTQTGTEITLNDTYEAQMEIGLNGNTHQGRLPSEYTQVDYIKSSGTQFIDTGVFPNTNIQVETNIEVTSTDQDTSVFGCYVSSLDNSLGRYYHLTPYNSKWYYGGDGQEENGGEYSSVVGTKYNIIFNNQDGNIVINDNTITVNISLTGYQDSTLTISRRGGTNSRHGKFKYYSFKIYDKNTQNYLRNFIPCYRNNDNVVGLYDLVNDVFYTNQGTGTFTYGSIAPTPESPIDIEVVTGDNTINVTGKNLYGTAIKTDNITGSSYNIITDTSNKLEIQGISNYYSGIYKKYQLKPNTQYTISLKYSEIGNNSKSRIYYKLGNDCENITMGDNNGNIDIGTTPTSLTFTTDNTGLAAIMFCCNWATNIGYIVYNDIQLEQGSIASTYEPYQSQEYPLNLGNIELCKIGDYQDYIYKENNKWYKHSEIGKVVLDGSETWTDQNNGGYTTNIPTKYNRYGTDGLICDHFHLRTGTSTTNYEGIDNDTTRIRVWNVGMTLENFKIWLGTNNTNVYYQLATPTNTEITDTDLINQLEELKKAKSVENKTIISQTNANLPFIISASALSKN